MLIFLLSSLSLLVSSELLAELRREEKRREREREEERERELRLPAVIVFLFDVMPQKHLYKAGKKPPRSKAKGKTKPPSRHGKIAKTKKGKLVKPPKSKALQDKYKQDLVS